LAWSAKDLVTFTPILMIFFGSDRCRVHGKPVQWTIKVFITTQVGSRFPVILKEILETFFSFEDDDIYMPERTTDTFRRPSSAHPAMIAAWNDEASEYSMNTARSVDYGRRRQQKLRSQITPPTAQLNYYE
jgi:hypothetical protein